MWPRRSQARRPNEASGGANSVPFWEMFHSLCSILCGGCMIKDLIWDSYLLDETHRVERMCLQ